MYNCKLKSTYLLSNILSPTVKAIKYFIFDIKCITYRNVNLKSYWKVDNEMNILFRKHASTHLYQLMHPFHIYLVIINVNIEIPGTRGDGYELSIIN